MSSQTALLNRFPITARELIGFLPVFLRSFFMVQWYGGAIILVLIGAIVAWRRKSLALFPLLLFAGYLLLYAFHIRSYYEMQSGSTDSRDGAALLDESYEHVVHSGGPWNSIHAQMGPAHSCLDRTIKSQRVGSRVSTVAAILGVSFFATSYFRDDVVGDEFRMRIEPSLTAIRIAAHDRTRGNYILTLEPLIPQMYADPSVNVLSLNDLDDTVMNEIGFSKGVTGVLYLDEADTSDSCG